MHNIESVAMACLIEAGVANLPVDVMLIAKRLNCTITSYEDAREFLEASGLLKYCEDHLSFSMQIEGEYKIFCSGSLTFEQKTLVIAHELGHIRLHLRGAGQIIGESADAEQQKRHEEEANEFARALLAPAAILRKIGATTPRQIERLTLLDEDEARRVSGEIAAQRNLRTNDIIDARICRQFRDFISSCNKDTRFSWSLRILPTIAAASVDVLIAIGAISAFTVLKKLADSKDK